MICSIYLDFVENICGLIFPIPHSSSPSAAYTKSAPPLPSPPLHLLSDPIISTALTCYQKFIKVETPFNIE